MKRKIIIKLLMTWIAILPMSDLFSQSSRWSYQAGEIFSKQPWTVYLFNKDTIYAVGYPAYVMRSVDGGSNWSITNLPSTQYANTVFFTDKNNGWVDVDGGELYRTTDAGLTWTKSAKLDSLSTSWTVGIHFSDANNGTAMGWNYTTGKFHFYKTANGGTTWTHFSSAPSKEAPYDVKWINANVGYIAANALGVMKTTNGGLTWTKLTLPSTGKYAILRIRDLSFIDENIGYAVGARNQFIKTNDGGATWDTLSSGFPHAPDNSNNYIAGVHFHTAQQGWIVNEAGNVRMTTDGGKTWVAQNSITGSNVMNMAFAKDGMTGVYAGQLPNLIAKTTDGGSTWTNLLDEGVSDNLRAITFADPTKGYAVGENGSIAYTDNGGTAWAKKNSGVSRILNSVAFASATQGWIVGDSGTVLKTTDGVNWTNVSVTTNENFNDVIFKTVSNGWIVGSSGSILKYNGSTWVAQISGTTQKLNAVYFADANNGWIAGDNGTILKTVNGGSNWTMSAPTGVLRNFNDIFFTTGSIGYIVGDNDYILKTTDAGNTWMPLVAPNEFVAHLKSVNFTSPHRGWAVGHKDGAATYYTTNGGVTWQRSSNPSNQGLNATYFPDLNNGWAVGNAGAILKFNDNANGTSDNTPTLPTYTFSATADTLKNFTANLLLKDSLSTTVDWNNNVWGYMVGMGGDYNEEFAEKYYISGRAQVLSVIHHNGGKLSHDKYVAELNIFNVDSTGYPDLKIGRQDVYFGDLKLDGSARNTVFTHPVVVKDSFFVAFNLTDFAHGGFEGDTISLYHTQNGTRPASDIGIVARNTARVHSHVAREWDRINQSATNKWMGYLALFPVVKFENSTGIENQFIAHSGLKLYAPYPNPSSDATIIRFEGNNNTTADISVYNLLGEKIYAATAESIKGVIVEHKIDISTFANGTYLITVNTGGNQLGTQISVVK